MKTKIREDLLSLQDETYRQFSSKLLPGTENILGVRLPELRKIAKKIAKSKEANDFLNFQPDFFEESMLQGMVIGYIDCDIMSRLEYIEKFIPKIDNWSTCDSFCSGLKFIKETPEEMWDFLLPYAHSKNEFEVRFALGTILFYYIDDRHLHEIFVITDEIAPSGYYAKMAIAWLISICYKVFPAETTQYLKKASLEFFTHNMAVQKILDSLSIPKEEKEAIKQLKRKDIII